MLEYLRDDDIDHHDDKLTAFEREKNRVRKICIGSCKMMDPKMEKNGAYEITPAKDDKYFECDSSKGGINGG